MSYATLVRRALTLAAIAAAPAVLPAALHAQITTPPAPKVFTACYVPSSGTIYRIKELDLKQTCTKASHVQFSWTDGNASALTKTFSVGTAITTIGPTHSGSLVVACPAGSQLVGGGYRITYFGNAAPVVMTNQAIDVSQPTPTSYWRVEMENMSTTDDLAFYALARCAH